MDKIEEVKKVLYQYDWENNRKSEIPDGVLRIGHED